MRKTFFAAACLALLAGCGPDCAEYCGKLRECDRTLNGTPDAQLAADERVCVDACDETGEDQARTIDCVIEHTCTEVFRGGRCDPTGVPGKTP